MVLNPHRYSVYNELGHAVYHSDYLPYCNKNEHLVFNNPPLFLPLEKALGNLSDGERVLFKEFPLLMSSVRRIVHAHASRLHRKASTIRIVHNEVEYEFHFNDCPRTENFDPILLGV